MTALQKGLFHREGAKDAKILSFSQTDLLFLRALRFFAVKGLFLESTHQKSVAKSYGSQITVTMPYKYG